MVSGQASKGEDLQGLAVSLTSSKAELLKADNNKILGMMRGDSPPAPASRWRPVGTYKVLSAAVSTFVHAQQHHLNCLTTKTGAR